MKMGSVVKYHISGLAALCAALCVAVILALCLAGPVYAEGTDETGEITVNYGIPVVYLEIDESDVTIEEMHGSPDHSVSCTGTFRIEVPEGFHYSDMPDMPCESTGKLGMKIRGRGNSTWRASKKPYKITLNDPADLFGIGENKHWVLLANAYDPTLMRNRITEWLGDQMGFEFTPSGVPVDLVMTGEEFGSWYMGSYYLSENVRVDTNRVNIDKLKKKDTDPLAITGGYLIQNSYQTRQGSPDILITRHGENWATHTPTFDVDYDDDAYENEGQYNYIRGHLQEMEDALFGENFINEKGEHYRDLMDVESAAKYWLVNEGTLNGDGYATGSTYIYKPRDTEDEVSKIYWGPLWDFDYAWNRRSTTEGFDNNGVWEKALLYDREEGGFIQKVKEYWPAMRAAMVELAKEDGIIDGYYEEVKDSAAANREKFPPVELGEDMVTTIQSPLSYEEEVEALKTWINNRIAWLDNNMPNIDKLVHKVRLVSENEAFDISYVSDGDYYFCPEDVPEKEDYLFLGWYDENGRKLDLQVTVESDLTYTAKFIPESEATHAEDIVFRKNNDVVKYFVQAPRYAIEYSLIPTDAQYRKVEWSSSNEDFATVDEDGVVTFKGTGEVTVTAKLKYGKSRDFTLTVVDGALPVPEAITPDAAEVEMTVGEQFPFRISTQPSPAKIESYEYRSDDESVVTVDDFGILTAVGAGQTRVSVLTESYDRETGDTITLETSMSVTVSKAPEPQPVSITGAVVTGLTDQTYTGSAITPGITVKLGGKTLSKGKDYTLSYSSNKNVGTAKIQVKGTGSYKDTKEVSFRINPKPTKIKSVKKRKKGFKVTWKKQATQVSGYQVRWSLKSDMSGARSKIISSNKKTSFKKTKLRKGKKYFVQVRTYKTVNGKKYWSKWSEKKKVKTK